jgi:rRNA maturation endonuclease Nob1
MTKAKCSKGGYVGGKFARSYKNFVFCTGCRAWLERTPENNYCPSCGVKTRKNTRSKMGQRVLNRM